MSMTTEQQERAAKVSRTPVTMMPVVSSQIAEIGHDPNTKTLAIRFNPRAGEGEKGPLYHYGNVDADLFMSFRDAPSVGSFFYANIKPNAEEFPYVKIESATAPSTGTPQAAYKPSEDAREEA